MVIFGQIDLEKPNQVKVNEADVHDGKGGFCTVHPGDQVELVDKSDESMNRWLGPGPYTIEWIGQWRCGRKSLYLKTTGGDNSGEPGSHASDFKIYH
jgi:hypothetical protein